MATEGQENDVVHEPVLPAEVLEWLQPARGGVFVDCTVGAGGHSRAILSASPEARVIGLDRDLEALAVARDRLAVFEARIRLIHANFADIAAVLDRIGVTGVRGVLADLGVSSLQLERGERGFSFAAEAPLDMRMDQSAGLTASDLVNDLSERELADLIFEYGEERGARRIARRVVSEREKRRISTTTQLAGIVVRALNLRGRWRIHPATRTFQALRIAVNDELRSLERFIPDAISALDGGGRLAVISFHSLEDRIVKRSFLRESGRCACEAPRGRYAPSDEIACQCCGARRRVKVLTRRPQRPGTDEIKRNPRSRSALLRVCERLEGVGSPSLQRSTLNQSVGN